MVTQCLRMNPRLSTFNYSGGGSKNICLGQPGETFLAFDTSWYDSLGQDLGSEVPRESDRETVAPR